MKTIEYSISEADAVRHLIVCDTQFTWAGVTNLTMPQMMDLQARGWVVEGDSNDEFQLTVAGEAVVARALEHGAPATLATVKPGGCVQLGDGPFAWSERAKDSALEAGQFAFTEADGKDLGYTACIEACVDAICSVLALPEHRAALSAQPSPGGQDALLASLVARWRKDADEIGASNNTLCKKVANCTMRHAAELQAALAARQPVGPMSAEASQIARGMVAHCIEHRLCMGMDEGFASFDPDVEHPFVQELREFVEGYRQPVGATVKDSLTVAGGQPVGDEERAETYRKGWEAGNAAQAVDLGPGLDAAAKLIQKKADDYAEEFGYDDMGGLSFGRGLHAEVKSDHHSFMLELVDELRALIDSQDSSNG